MRTEVADLMLDPKNIELAECVGSWPFSRLEEIAMEARRLLRQSDLEELRRYGGALCEKIEQRKCDEVYWATEACVKRLLAQGGPELRYYPPDRDVTEAGVRELLENWPEEADLCSPVPSVEMLSDLDVLASFLDSGWFQPDDQHPLTAPANGLGPDHELWALLTLLKVGEAMWWMAARLIAPIDTDL